MAFRMTPTDRIMGPTRGSLETVLAYADQFILPRKEHTYQYFRAVFELCEQIGMDATIPIAQSHLESFNVELGIPWASKWVRDRGNYFGMGITGDKEQETRSPVFDTGVQAARAQVGHLLLYATGYIDQGDLTPADDPRYAAYIEKFRNWPRAPRIDGLVNSWAMDEEYAIKICSRGNTIFNFEGNKTSPVFAPPRVLRDIHGVPFSGEADAYCNNTIVYAQPRTVRFCVETRALQYGEEVAPEVAPPYEKDEVTNVLGFFEGMYGNDRCYYWVTEDYARVPHFFTYDVPIVMVPVDCLIM